MTSANKRSLPFPQQAEARKWAPCRAACPVHVDVPGYLSAVAEGRFSDALAIILERNPLPAVCGRICLRPCEEGCRRCLLDDPVAIAHIKRAASDHGLYPAPRPDRPRGESIGIVGSGPAGLTAAYDLAKTGYNVTIYEAKPKLGGMLRYGIPRHRLPDASLDRDIQNILANGVRVETGVRVGRDVTIDELRERHAALLVAVGLQVSRPLPIPGAEMPRVLAALPFLEAVANGETVDLGSRVVVVGGGNVAMDVARCALRMGAKDVTCVCLESRDEMPASPHELADAEEEGVKVICSRGPRAVTGEGAVSGLDVVECTSVFDEDHRFAPTFNEEHRENIPADSVVFAVGQGCDSADLGLPTSARGMLAVASRTLETPVPGVYAAGDDVTGPTKVIDAIAAGHRAAAGVIEQLRNDSSVLEELDAEREALGQVPGGMAERIEIRKRIQMERLEFYEAVKGFEEVELGYTEYEAAREAQRCLSCTTGARLQREKCAACLTCTRICPNGAPVFQPGGYPYFSAEACHACGACAAECPAGAINIEGCSEMEMTHRVERHLAWPEFDTVLAFVCGYSPELTSSLGHDPHIITVSCLLRVSERVVFEAFELGAARVVFSACNPEGCRFPHAIPIVARRVARIRSLAEEVALGEYFAVVGQAAEGEAGGGAPTPDGGEAKAAGPPKRTASAAGGGRKGVRRS